MDTMDTVDLDEVLDDAVAGLGADPELRLDVRRELLAHVEDAKATLPDGTESERLAGALKALGPVTELAGALADSNRRRMRFRGWARGLLVWAAVPAAVAVAVGIGIESLMRAGVVAGAFRSEVALPDLDSRLVRGLSEDEALLVLGDLSREARPAQQKAIWERYPDEMMYFGNYVSEVLAATSRNEDDSADEGVEEVLREGMRLEPNNARYPYQLAGLLLRRGVDLTHRGEEGEGPVAAVDVNDWTAVDEALPLLRQAQDCSVYQRHTRELVAKRLAILPDPGSLLEQISQFSFLAQILLPDVSPLMSTARVAPGLADHLREADRDVDAVMLLGVGDHLPDVLRKDAFTLIDALVVGALIKMGPEQFAPAWEKVGRPEEADRVRALSERRSEPFERFKQRKKSDPIEDQVLEEKASMLVSMLVPALGETIDPDSLVAGRRLEFVMVEQVWSMVTIWVMTVLMLGALAIWVRWRKVEGAASAPFLLVPTGRQAAMVFLTGVVAPVVVYAALSRLPGIGARVYSLSFLRYRFAAELLLLGVTVAGLSGWMASRFVRRRCAALGLALPPHRSRGERVLGALLGGGWILCLVTGRWAVGGPVEWAALVVAGVLVVFAVARMLWVLVGALRSPSRYGLYVGTWGRTLTATYAVAVLLLALMTLPGLRRLESTWVRLDPLMSLDEGGGFTQLESQVTQRILNELDEVWDASNPE